MSKVNNKLRKQLHDLVMQYFKISEDKQLVVLEICDGLLICIDVTKHSSIPFHKIGRLLSGKKAED